MANAKNGYVLFTIPLQHTKPPSSNVDHRSEGWIWVKQGKKTHVFHMFKTKRHQFNRFDIRMENLKYSTIVSLDMSDRIMSDYNGPSSNEPHIEVAILTPSILNEIHFSFLIFFSYDERFWFPYWHYLHWLNMIFFILNLVA